MYDHYNHVKILKLLVGTLCFLFLPIKIRHRSMKRTNGQNKKEILSFCVIGTPDNYGL